MNGAQRAVDRGWPALALGALALGLASANWVSRPWLAGLVCATAAAAALLHLPMSIRLSLAALALGAAGLWWGGLRLHELDRSILVSRIGEPAAARAVVTGAASRSPFATRMMAEALRFDGVELRERVLLELPVGRAPPQGCRARAPGAPGRPARARDRLRRARHGSNGGAFTSSSTRAASGASSAGGAGSVASATGCARPSSTRSRSGRQASDAHSSSASCSVRTRESIRSFGTHSRPLASTTCSAVSGQNIVLIGFGVLGLAYVAGFGRVIGHTAAIVAILAYALAVGWQPSVVRAAVAGCLASVAWLLSRPSDRWHAMAMGAVVLLAWTPRSLFEPGFQLSFVAVAAIFLTLPRLRRFSEGYPVPTSLVEVVGISAACGIATAPILWLQFGTVPIWTVAANALAEPAMPVLLGCGLAATVLAPVIPSAALSLSWIAGVAAAWIAFAARLIASLPHAQTSSRTVVLCLAGVIVATGGSARTSELPSARSRRHRGGSRPFPRGRVVGSSPTPVVVAAGRVAGVVPRRRAGRRNPPRDERGCHARRCRPARGTGRPPAPADGAAPARGARDLARAPRSRRGRPCRVALARGRCGDRPDAARLRA